MSGPVGLLIPHLPHRVPTDGRTTCLWHRSWEHYMRWHAPYSRRCDLCGGRTGDHRAARQELCRLRAQRGIHPLPVIDNVSQCYCADCRAAEEVTP